MAGVEEADASEADARGVTEARPSSTPHPSRESIVWMGGGRKAGASPASETSRGAGRRADQAAGAGAAAGWWAVQAAGAVSARVRNSKGEFTPGMEPGRAHGELTPWKERSRTRSDERRAPAWKERVRFPARQRSSSEGESPMDWGESTAGGRGKSGRLPEDGGGS